uniref:Uncharacterized protein n=1 Tax=Leersia perrieri TaxID=77586 RepID=A0A0D9WQV0_9ORYZ
MLTALESELDNSAADPVDVNYLIPLQKCIFSFLCKALVSDDDPAADELVDRLGFFICEAGSDHDSRDALHCIGFNLYYGM